jgi:crossover junction endodeoxyribonuclease RusA
MTGAEELTFRITLPYPRPPRGLTGNTRTHWRVKAASTKQVRSDVTTLAWKARIPQSTHLTVELIWAPGNRIKRDADNLWPFLKVCCDALAKGARRDWVGLELVEDDSPEYMTKLTPRIVPPPAVGMWLDVTARGPFGPRGQTALHLPGVAP